MDLGWLGRVALRAYIAVLAALCVYGLHRYYLVLTFFRVRRQAPVPQGRFDPLPHVTVQLPMFNERYVARRIIEQTCKIDYPRHLLEIQVLDDSTDESADIARDAVARLRAAGHGIVYLHRSARSGHKAGALEEGARGAKGEFIAVFGADFLRMTDQADPLAGRVRPRPGDHRHPARHQPDNLFDDDAVFLVRQGRAFAGGAHRNRRDVEHGVTQPNQRKAEQDEGDIPIGPSGDAATGPKDAHEHVAQGREARGRALDE